MGKNSHKSDWECNRSNGYICLSCLRRASWTKKKEEDAPFREPEKICHHCGSTSMEFVGWLDRLPRRTASRGKWAKFIKEHLHWKWSNGIENGKWVNDDLPEDFMENVK